MDASGAGLRGKRVLLARAEGQADGPAQLLRDRGAHPVVVPSIVLGPPDDEGPLARALAELAAFDWVVFTSVNGVDHTWRTLEARGLGPEAFGAARFAVVGVATAEAVQARGRVVDVVAREHRGEGLAAALLEAFAASGQKSPRVLLLRAQEGRDVLRQALVESGVEVTVAPVYRTRPDPAGAAEVARQVTAGLVDAVVFSSGSTVDSICDAMGLRAPVLLATVCVACIGPVTVTAARSRGVRVDVVPGTATFPAVVDALDRHWAEVDIVGQSGCSAVGPRHSCR